MINSIKVSTAPINTIEEAFSDPQTQARGMVVKMQHDRIGEEIRLAGNPIKLGETPVEYRLPPPLLGQHTDEVLGDILHLSPADIAQLRSERII